MTQVGGAAPKSDFSGKVVGPSFLLICCSHEWELSPCKVGTKKFGALVTYGGSEVANFFHSACKIFMYFSILRVESVLESTWESTCDPFVAVEPPPKGPPQQNQYAHPLT